MVEGVFYEKHFIFRFFALISLLMKKVFPSIIILITLSLLGLMFLQMYWIQNGILAQKGRYNSDVETSFDNIKAGLKTRIALTLGYSPTSLNWDTENPIISNILWSTLSSISSNDINDIIQDELVKNNINLPFEYAITENRLFTNNSNGFKQEMIPESYQRTLNYDGNYVFYLYIKQPENYILNRTAWMIATSLLFTFIIILAFTITVMTVFKQKQLSEIKTDFINNMTHEFKTPLATISLAVDALNYEKVQNNPQQIKYYTGIIKEENIRMNKQVEKILTTAKIDSHTLELQLQDVDVHMVIKKIAPNIEIRLEDSNGILDVELLAKNYIIKADEVHFSNIIGNLMDNAIKYSPEPVRIKISTSNKSNKTLLIKIKDNGIGMNKDTINHIFEKFYRAHTGNLHNVKGFGLGLSYVKSVVDAHGGKIKVESILGKGSTFLLEFPLPNDQRHDT